MIWEMIVRFALLMALTAFFVTWAKLDEQKQKTKEEHECYEAMLRLHNGVAIHAQELEAEKDALNAEIARLNECLDTEFEFADAQIDKNREMQDHLSAILCPSNNHIWKDGKCIKCGRNEE